jgi:sporulation protein YlmC with PRC-barrel domain
MIKTELDIPMDAKVFCSGDICGHITHIIINPITNQVTDVVVRDYEVPQIERLVPVELITKSSSDTVQLTISKDRIRTFPAFRYTHFIRVTTPVKSVGLPIYMMWPYVVSQEKLIPFEAEGIPPDELAIQRNARVIATDGQVGKVDEFLIDSGTGNITHLVLREGHLWGKKDIVIPVSAIKHIGEDAVELKIDKKSIETLPVIPINRKE